LDLRAIVPFVQSLVSGVAPAAGTAQANSTAAGEETEPARLFLDFRFRVFLYASPRFEAFSRIQDGPCHVASRLTLEKHHEASACAVIRRQVGCRPAMDTVSASQKGREQGAGPGKPET
jgi:hypothetical protein